MLFHTSGDVSVLMLSLTDTRRESGKDNRIKRNMTCRKQKIGNWDRCIILDESKESLANFLCTDMSETYRGQPRKELVLNEGFNDPMKVWSSTKRDLGGLASVHEEADRRIILHARDAAIYLSICSTCCTHVKPF